MKLDFTWGLHPPKTIISQEEHANRRATLMSNLDEGDAVFLAGNNEVPRNPDVPYPFRQESNFRYLTGIDLPGVSALLIPGERRYILFANAQTIDAKVWDGEMPSHQDLRTWFLADEVHEPGSVAAIAQSYAPKRVLTIHQSAPFRVQGTMQNVDDRLADILFFMRLIKSDAEIRAIEESLRITADGYDAVMKATRPGPMEHNIQALLEYKFRDAGASLAFPSIVTMDGSVLHNPDYRRQFINERLVDGRLLLIDSGAEVEGYGADITRTIPISGRYTGEQADAYDAVLWAKKTAIGMIEPTVSYLAIHLAAERVIADALRNMGVLRGNLDDIIESGAHRLFTAHGLGHALGLDDHDAGEWKDRVAGYSKVHPRSDKFGLKSLRFARPLVQGMTVTAEPGMYFIDGLLNDEQTRERYREFIDFDKAARFKESVSGIRIEDDVLVTETGHRVLGPYIPQERREIEAIMRG